MSKYRILKLGNSDQYLIQKKIWFFWYTVMGNYLGVYSIEEARLWLKYYNKKEASLAALKAPNSVVE